MSVLYLLLPLALLLASLAVAGFVWAVRRGQFDDLETPAMRVLFDEDVASAEGSAPASRASSPRPFGDALGDGGDDDDGRDGGGRAPEAVGGREGR